MQHSALISPATRSNGYGQIGSSSPTNTLILTPTTVAGSNTFTSISAGALHTCGATAAAVKCWDDNGRGQHHTVRCTGTAPPLQAAAS
jgi:hypothetical protein